jgi:4-hydroxy-tetrahydrodipicolinate reductase
MGRRLAALAAGSTDIKIVAGLASRGSPRLGKDVGDVSLVGTLGARIFPAERIDKVVKDARPDVLVDFTNAEASTANVVAASGLGVRIVMGTTGHSQEQMGRILDSIKTNRVAAVIAPNMSIGVNVLLEACRLAAQMLPGYDVEILEVHHNQKIDAPSGTALKLAGVVSEALHRDVAKDVVSGRSGTRKRGEREIGIASLRAGDIVGDHTVLFAGPGERIELTHRAHSRDAFASGVLSSIRFVSKAEPGIYSMRDVLKPAPGG